MADNVFQQIKDKVSCVSYAQLLGWDIKKSGDRTFSLEKGSNKTALVVHNNYWYDFKTCQGGDVIDLCALVNHNGDKGEAAKELSRIANIEPTEKHKKWQEYTQNLCNLIAKWHTQLKPEHIEYLRSRKITDETINKLRIGFNQNRIIIPYYKNNHVAYWIGRGENPKYFKPKLDGLNENIPWGMHTLNRNNNSLLVIAEGAFDALSFDQEGYSVLATMGGHFSKTQLRQVLDIAKTYDEVFLCFDSDEAGNKFLSDLSQILFTNKINFSCNQLLDDKDISDYYTRGGSLKDLINNKKDGLKFMCERIADKEDFKSFIKQVARYTGKAEMAELFQLVKEKFSRVWLAEIKKQAMSSPTEDLISKEIAIKYMLKYNPKLGFYEYKNGYWQQQTDEQIKNYIIEQLGHFATGSKAVTICSLLKSKLVTNDVFNEKPIFNFKNGILELDTGEFKEHSPLYNSSFQVNYCYDSSLNSSNWQQFLRDITNDDERKINLLQELTGYVLFNDCSLQKCFFLIGHGANGKSVFLEVLNQLFGKENVSNVEMSSLTEPFQRICLMNSLINISSETASDVKGAESYFKQIVVGDTISGCYKGKDFITFNPRCKFITASNDYIQTRDISEGFDRRIIFIEFPIKFTENPTNDNEKKVDKDITKKLLKELPAIFNWAYNGYKILKDQKEFTVTQEQEEIKQEFREINNAVYVFLKEFKFPDIPDFIDFKVLYNEYRLWCRESGRMIKSSSSFGRDLKNTVKTFFANEIEYKRNEKQRGYCKINNDSKF